ncbi:MAG: hypothetical protein M0Z50_12460 [Planctomycetia bacterium]|jgi:hypothetical protein|nr:hypothetical protein [Planctomycetia bacterium]
MGVYEGRGQLTKAFNHLQLRWEEVKIGWSDANSERFEKKYLIPLGTDLRTATSAMEHIAMVLNKVRRDCQ